jgi:hypothetical protein
MKPADNSPGEQAFARTEPADNSPGEQAFARLMAVLERKHQLEDALKERSMVYQADWKERVAAKLGKPAGYFYKWPMRHFIRAARIAGIPTQH